MEKIDSQLTVKIKTPSGVMWRGNAKVVSSENSEGKFDILPGHANFLTLIANEPIVVVDQEKTRKFKFEKAVIYVLNDEISIYTHLLHKR